MTELLDIYERAAGVEVAIEARDALARLLEAHCQEGAQAWPELTIARDRFVQFLGERAGVACPDDHLEALESLRAPDLYLACACMQDDARALTLFEERVVAQTQRAVKRIDAAPDFVADVLQMTRVHLLVAEAGRPKRLLSYRGTGKLTSWVQVVAVRHALALRRRQRPDQPGHDDAELIDAAGVKDDPELAHVRLLYRAEFSEALSQACAQLSSRDRNVLRMYLFDGLNIDRIGVVYRVHRATVARWIARAQKTLREETSRLLALKLGVTGAELESIARVVQSHLDLSVERMLGPSKN